MEQLVVNPIEKRMNELDDIKRISSRIDDGLAVVRIDFKYEVNPDTKYQDIVRELNAIRADLPTEILSLNVMKFSPSDVNIIQAGLMSEVAPYSELEAQATRLKKALEKVKTLKNVNSYAFPPQRVTTVLMHLLQPQNKSV